MKNDKLLKVIFSKEGKFIDIGLFLESHSRLQYSVRLDLEPSVGKPLGHEQLLQKKNLQFL